MDKYTCAEYRQEMILVGLRKQLSKPDLSESERKNLETQIEKIEEAMGLS
jgi:hypothetical protein